MNRRAYIANMLKTRLKQHNLKPSEHHFDELFVEFYQCWARAQARSPNPKEATIWLLNALESFLKAERRKQENCK